MSTRRTPGARLARLSIAGVVASALAAHAGCSGKAVIDGGAGGAATTSSSGSTSPLCSTPDPVGNLELCAGTSGQGAGQPFACESTECDQDGNTWTSLCTDDGCQCRFNGQQRCSCTGGTCGDSCCPAPFPK